MSPPGRIEWRVTVGDEETLTVFEPALGAPGSALFVCAHGAGGHMADRGMIARDRAPRVAVGSTSCGSTFSIAHRVPAGPTRCPVCTACIAAVVAHARRELEPERLILGGRSMGGRAASMLAADGFACDGLLLLAYPLHPAGKPEKLRDAHLAQIGVPVLCLNGTRDALCRRDLMERAVARLDRWTLHWLEGADHSFQVLKRSGRSACRRARRGRDAHAAWAAGLTRER